MSDIVIVRGDEWPLSMVIVGKTTKEPMDLTGFTVVMTVTRVKSPLDDSSKLFSCVGEVDPDQVANRGRVVFIPTQDNTKENGKFFYDVEITKGSRRKTFNNGSKFVIEQDNTKSPASTSFVEPFNNYIGAENYTDAENYND